MNSFPDVLSRLKHLLRVSKDNEVALILGMTKTAFAERKRRGSFPDRELRQLAAERPDLEIDVDYVLNGATAKDTAARMLANFGPRLREVRGDQSPAKFAKLIGVSTADLAALEAGKRKPTTDEVMRLQKAHPERPVNWLLGGEAPQLDSPPSDLEVILLRNYRASDEQGRAALREQAAFYARIAGESRAVDQVDLVADYRSNRK